MSDSFADLWNSSAPTKPAPAPSKLGSITPQSSSASTSSTRKGQYDAFSILSNSSTPTSRSITPSLAAKSPPLATAPSRSTGDAFSGLFSGSGGAANGGANLTMAERAAKVEREKREAQMNSFKQPPSSSVNASQWVGLDTLGVPTSESTPVSDPSAGDDWAFSLSNNQPTKESVAVRQSKTPSAVSQNDDDDDWGLADFASSKPTKPSPSPVPTSSAAKKNQAIWDLDDFASVPSSSRVSPSPPPASRRRADSPSDDFDFGNREDKLLNNEGNMSDGDDLLGMLGKPVDVVRKSSPSLRPPVKSSSRSNGSSRTSSPPPHIIGQIVEMGFTPQQARVALASTDTGLDVQAALDTLLSNGANGNSNSSPPPINTSSPPPQGRRPQQTSDRRGSDSTSDFAFAVPRRRDRERQRERDRERTTGDGDESSQQGSKQFGDQADKLIAQASELGMNVFNKANSFWSMGKEKVQKAYEERAAAAAAAKAAETGGKPRWMVEQQASHEDGDDSNLRRPLSTRGGRKTVDDGWGDQDTSNGFKDDDNEDPVPEPSKPKKISPRKQQQAAPVEEVDLFSSNEVAPATSSAYVSRFRHGRPAASTSSSQLSAPSPRRAPTPPPARQLVEASSSALSSAISLKTQGTEKYKLGAYGDAESLYTRAISALPEGHILLVNLYNNRAIARLKVGDPRGAGEDAGVVIGLVSRDNEGSWAPTVNDSVLSVQSGASEEKVDLGEGMVKAWRRRAESNEARERWEDAKKDWERVAGCGWTNAKTRAEGAQGAGRCRKMLNTGESAGTGASSKPKPTPKPKAPVPRPAVRRGPTPPSQALSTLRASTSAAEAEDNQRHELKDAVDAKLTAWKGGKETNIRALLASLDTVLWPELKWENVGMKDLITDKQVKIKYTKAISRVHPDKLAAANTKLEHRMIANGVFGALNDAWNAFQQ